MNHDCRLRLHEELRENNSALPRNYLIGNTNLLNCPACLNLDEFAMQLINF